MALLIRISIFPNVSVAFKIASFEAIDIPLIQYAASTGKPLIISTGMADVQEIEEAIDAARSGGCKELAILHCVSGYPAKPADYNLNTITDMIRRFGIVVGLSDHTIENTTAIASVSLGTSIIEKHFTLNRSGGGADDSFSIEPNELSQLCTCARIAWESLGKVDYGQKSSERNNLRFRRSLYFVRPVKAGERITDAHVKSIRPSCGIKPKYLDEVIGRFATADVEEGTPVSWDLIR